MIHSKELSFGTLGTKHKMIIGENYDALQELSSAYKDKVDVIYIDPPYNTKNKGFQYSDTSTRTAWLLFMQERLKLARKLLSESGVIFISIDDNEQAYLKVLCDEIFGEDNFVNQIIWYYSAMSSKPKKSLRSANEYILMYAKQKESFTLNDLKESKMKNRNIINTIQNLSQHYNFTVNEAMINLGYEFDEEYQDWFSWYAKDTKDYFTNTIDNVWYVPVVNRMAHEYIPEFNNQKPTTLIKKILQISSKPNSTILDFFAGSGTTGQAVMELNEEDGGNRECILVTNNENGIAKNITRERLYRVCNGVGTKGEEFKWEYKKDQKCLQNNIWDIFEIG